MRPDPIPLQHLPHSGPSPTADDAASLVSTASNLAVATVSDIDTANWAFVRPSPPQPLNLPPSPQAGTLTESVGQDREGAMASRNLGAPSAPIADVGLKTDGIRRPCAFRAYHAPTRTSTT